MARQVSNVISLPPGYGNTQRRWYFLMTDATMWSLNTTGAVWTQAPALPGSRVACAIYATSALLDPYLKDVVYAAATDGTIWSSPVSPFSWSLVATAP